MESVFFSKKPPGLEGRRLLGNQQEKRGKFECFPVSTFPCGTSLVIIFKFGYWSYKYKKVNSVTPVS